MQWNDWSDRSSLDRTTKDVPVVIVPGRDDFASFNDTRPHLERHLTADRGVARAVEIGLQSECV